VLEYCAVSELHLATTALKLFIKLLFGNTTAAIAAAAYQLNSWASAVFPNGSERAVNLELTILTAAISAPGE